MEKIFLSIFILFSTLPCSAQTVLDVSSPTDVNQSSSRYRGPKIGVDDNGHPILYSGIADSLFVFTWQGQGFNPPDHVQTPGLQPFTDSQEGPGMAVSGDKVFISFQDDNSGNMYLVSSYNRGLSFAAPILVPGSGILPMVGTNNNGHPLVTYLEKNNKVELVQSATFGQSFSSPTVTSAGASSNVVCECCPPEIVSGPGDQLLSIFRNNDQNIRDVWVTQSADSGKTFPVSVDIDNLDWQVNSCPASGPDAMVGGTLLRSVWYSGAVNPSQVFISEVDLNTMTLTHQIALHDSVPGQQNFPKIAGNGDTLGVVWTEFVDTSNDILMAWSTTGVTGLKNNVVNLSQTSAGSERFADIAFSNGKFHIVYESFLEQVLKYQTASIGPTVGLFDLKKEAFPLQVFVDHDEQLVEVTFPNPTYFSFDWELVSMDGKAILNGRVAQSQLRFSTNAIPAGMYVLRVSGDGVSGVKKIAVF